MTRLYLGVDGGQSSTTALIADETGLVIGEGRGGPCNHVKASEAVAKFNHVIRECLDQACKEAGLDRAAVRFSAACFGFSGGPEDKSSLVQGLVHSDRYHVTHDAEIALTGATAGEPGIIVISGTGSMAFGRNRQGKCARAGGWGYIFGDEGGAFDLVRQAVRAALRAEEGWGPSTSLRKRLLEAVAAQSANAMLHAFYTPDYPRSRVAALARLVDEEVNAGDEVAANILRTAAHQLAGLVRAVRIQLFQPSDTSPVVPIGGTFSSLTLRRELQTALDYPLAEPRMTPAAGALLQALRLDSNLNMPAGPGLARSGAQ